MSDPKPAHLTPTFSNRDFARMPELNGTYGEEVHVYESSAATGPHIWLKVEANDDEGGRVQVHLHLTADNAWRLSEQLQELVCNHYQGDATPEWAAR